ncbi:MAG: hypothetical protein AAGH19_06290 [Pseudomonadota bacterium]
MHPVNERVSTLPVKLPPANNTQATLPGTLAVAWGVGGFVLLMGFALWRLVPLARESFDYAWGWHHAAVFAINLAFMAWTEGYRGFQQAFSPRFGARCHHLLHHATWGQALLAPLVTMNFICAPRRRVIVAWALTIGIIAVVLLYRQLPQPWRGILDAGVVLGLAWGLISTLVHVVLALRRGPGVDPEFRG